MSTKYGVLAVVAFVMLCAPVTGDGAEKFQKLSGPQIRARFTGMEMTDNVHWADVFGGNGSLTAYSMGKKKEGKWRIDNDELCIERGKDEGGCYQVWMSGTKVEFRREGLPDAIFEGVLQRRTARN